MARPRKNTNVVYERKPEPQADVPEVKVSVQCAQKNNKGLFWAIVAFTILGLLCLSYMGALAYAVVGVGLPALCQFLLDNISVAAPFVAGLIAVFGFSGIIYYMLKD